MAFIVLADQSDSIETVFFPRTYTEHRASLTPGSCVAVKGRLSIRNDEVSIAVERVKAFGVNQDSTDT